MNHDLLSEGHESITSKMYPSIYRAMRLSFLRGFQVQVNQALPSTQSSLKANVAMWNRSAPMPANSLGKWISRMLILLKDYRLPFRSIKNLLTEILDLL